VSDWPLHAYADFALAWGAAASFCQPISVAALDSSPRFNQSSRGLFLKPVEQWTNQLLRRNRPWGHARAGHIGRSSLNWLTFFRLAQRAATNHVRLARFLSSGETGTAKELRAQAIYKHDENRGHGSFVFINCAAWSRELSDSDCSGHPGIFHWRWHDRPGMFRSAHGGHLGSSREIAVSSTCPCKAICFACPPGELCTPR